MIQTRRWPRNAFARMLIHLRRTSFPTPIERPEACSFSIVLRQPCILPVTVESIIMATDAHGLIVNGGQTSSKSPAALLSEQHARDQAHKVTVEDVPDEDDIQHPPPSSSVKSAAPDAGAGSSKDATPNAGSAPEPKTTKTSNTPAFDVRSEESFPALGSGPKSKAAANVPSAWGARKPGAASTSTNGVSSGPQASSTFPLSTPITALFKFD